MGMPRDATPEEEAIIDRAEAIVRKAMRDPLCRPPKVGDVVCTEPLLVEVVEVHPDRCVIHVHLQPYVHGLTFDVGLFDPGQGT
jgi:hypothetical protein